MNTLEIRNFARENADSVFDYIKRTAQYSKDGIFWETKAYNNQPHFHPSLFNGVAGISLFLTDYYQVTGIEEAYNLAVGAVEWSAKQSFESFALYFDEGGIGYAFLRLYQVKKDKKFIELFYLTKNELWLKRANSFALMCCNYKKNTPEGDIWTADKEGYFSPDFYCGAAGTGHFFLRLASVEKISIPVG